MPVRGASPRAPLRAGVIACAALTSTLIGCGGGGGGSDGGSSPPPQAPPPQTVPSLTLTANASTSEFDSSVTLTWSSSDATSCEASGGWSGPRGLSGTETVRNLRATTTFVLHCSSGTQSASASARINVKLPAGPSLEFTADKTLVRRREGIVLTWKGTNVDSCRGTWRLPDARPTEGSRTSSGPAPPRHPAGARHTRGGRSAASGRRARLRPR